MIRNLGWIELQAHLFITVKCPVLSLGFLYYSFRFVSSLSQSIHITPLITDRARDYPSSGCLCAATPVKSMRCCLLTALKPSKRLHWLPVAHAQDSLITSPWTVFPGTPILLWNIFRTYFLTGTSMMSLQSVSVRCGYVEQRLGNSSCKIYAFFQTLERRDDAFQLFLSWTLILVFKF